jgi:hypothetical protein
MSKTDHEHGRSTTIDVAKAASDKMMWGSPMDIELPCSVRLGTKKRLTVNFDRLIDDYAAVEKVLADLVDSHYVRTDDDGDTPGVCMGLLDVSVADMRTSESSVENIGLTLALPSVRDVLSSFAPRVAGTGLLNIYDHEKPLYFVNGMRCAATWNPGATAPPGPLVLVEEKSSLLPYARFKDGTMAGGGADTFVPMLHGYAITERTASGGGGVATAVLNDIVVQAGAHVRKKCHVLLNPTSYPGGWFKHVNVSDPLQKDANVLVSVDAFALASYQFLHNFLNSRSVRLPEAGITFDTATSVVGRPFDVNFTCKMRIAPVVMRQTGDDLVHNRASRQCKEVEKFVKKRDGADSST